MSKEIIITGIAIVSLLGYQNYDEIKIKYNEAKKTEEKALSEDVKWLEQEFRNIYGKSIPNIGEGLNDMDNISIEFAWQSYYWLRFYVVMHELTEKDIYLEKSEKLIEYMYKYTDQARYDRGELKGENNYSVAPLHILRDRTLYSPGWRRYHLGGVRASALDDGQITNAIMTYVEYIYDNNIEERKEKANEFKNKAEIIVDSHDDEYVSYRYKGIPGSYYYPASDGSRLYTSTRGLNQSLTIGTTQVKLDKINKTDKYKKRIEELAEYFKISVWKDENGAYVWDYNPQTTVESKIEDSGHGHVDINFFIDAYRNGYIFNESDFLGFYKTLEQNIVIDDKNCAGYVDGNEEGFKEPGKNDYCYFLGYDWIELAEQNPEILKDIRSIYQDKYSKPNWSRPFLGWANIIKWEQKIKNN